MYDVYDACVMCMMYDVYVQLLCCMMRDGSRGEGTPPSRGWVGGTRGVEGRCPPSRKGEGVQGRRHPPHENYETKDHKGHYETRKGPSRCKGHVKDLHDVKDM